MSSFKNFSSMLNDLQRQADGRGTLDGSAIEDFLSIAGYKECGGGGGGGGGDFTTAEVTLKTESGPASVFVPYANADFASAQYSLESETTLTVILYKGVAEIWSADVEVYSVSENGTIDDGIAYITGDCTVTFYVDNV